MNCCIARSRRRVWLQPSRSAHRAGAGAGLSDPHHHDDRAVRGRRSDRRHRAHRRRPHVADARPELVIENVVGAGGTTGATRAERAANDGYTLITGHMGTHAASVALYPKLAYDPDKDFEPIGCSPARRS